MLPVLSETQTDQVPTLDLSGMSEASQARYGRLTGVSGFESITPDEYDRMFQDMDTDGNKSLKKAELTAYLDSTDYSQAIKRQLFDVYRTTSKWTNPY